MDYEPVQVAQKRTSFCPSKAEWVPETFASGSGAIEDSSVEPLAADSVPNVSEAVTDDAIGGPVVRKGSVTRGADGEKPGDSPPS